MTRDPENDGAGELPESPTQDGGLDEPREPAREVPSVSTEPSSEPEADSPIEPNDEATDGAASLEDHEDDARGPDAQVDAEVDAEAGKAAEKAKPPTPDRARSLALFSSIAIALTLGIGSRLSGGGSSTSQPTIDGGVDAGLAMVLDSPERGGPAVVASALPSPKDPPAPAKTPPVWRVASLKEDAGMTYTEGTVGKRTLTGALSHAGLSSRETHRLLKAFEGKKKLDRSRPKDTFAFAVDKEKGRLVAFELTTSPEDVWQAREDDTSTLGVKKLELSVERRRVAVGFAVTGELHEAVTRAGLDDDAMKRLDDALDGHFELSDLRPGTRLRLVLTELRVEGALARYAHVDAVEVHPPVGTATVRVYHFDDEAADPEAKERGKDNKKRGHRDRPTGFFDAKGHQPYHGGWRSPVPGARISSRFNPTRLHPVLHVVMPHNGIDFAAPTGAKVYASSAGSVIMAGNGGPCGNMVQIEHLGGLVTAYCHLSKFAAGLHAGQHVDTRQLIGYVGATGRVTGPHLHFALKKDQKFVDPMSLKMDGVRVLPPKDRDAFASVRAALDAALDAVPLPAPVTPGDAGTKDEEVFDDGDDEGDGGSGSGTRLDGGSP